MKRFLLMPIVLVKSRLEFRLWFASRTVLLVTITDRVNMLVSPIEVIA